MSKTWEHYHDAARHHENAAYHYKATAKYDQAEEHEKAAHFAYLAHGHTQKALDHECLVATNTATLKRQPLRRRNLTKSAA